MVTYDPVTRDWAELVTAGQVPAPTAGAASAVSSEGTLYVYGGVARGDRHGFWLVDTGWLRKKPCGDCAHIDAHVLH